VLAYAVWCVGTLILTATCSVRRRYGHVAIEAGLRRVSPWRPLLVNGVAIALALAAILAFGRISMLVLTALGVPAPGTMSIWAYILFW
jgi:hypothetical protein